MSQNNLDDIVKVDIDLNAPAVDNASFDHLLLFGPGPRLQMGAPPSETGIYSSLAEVNEAGWISVGQNADPVGVAAMVAFSQSPQPSKVYIAVQKELEPLLDTMQVQVITTDSVGNLLPADAYQTPPESLPWLQVIFRQQDLTGGELSIVVEKDGVLIYGGNLTRLVADRQAYFQAVLGSAQEGEPVGLNLESSQLNGVYRVTLEAVSGDRKTTLDQTVRFDGTVATVVDSGFSAPELEHPVVTLERALPYTGWYAACPAGVPEKQFEAIAQWTETQTKLFCYTWMGETNPVGEVYYRSCGWYGKEYADQREEDVPPANRYLSVAAAADCLAYEAGSETWAFKSLSAVYPSVLTSTQMKELKENGGNYYTAYAGKNITQNGKVRAGEWIDVIRFRDWLQNDMQLRLFNLFLMNPKIPYTNGGIGLVENQMIASLKAGTDKGGVAPDEYDEDGKKIPGFTVTVPNAARLTASQKASRILTGCKFRARIAGAIHAIEVSGGLTYANA